MKKRLISVAIILAVIVGLPPVTLAAEPVLKYYDHCTMIPDAGEYFGVESFNEINLGPDMNTYSCAYYYRMSDIAMEEMIDYIDVLKDLGFKDYDPVLELSNTIFSGKNAQGDEVEVGFVTSGYWTIDVRHPVDYAKGLYFMGEESTAPAGTVNRFENFAKTNIYTEKQFADVVITDWFADSVRSAYELGLMKGQSSDSFGVNAPLTFAETIALAARLHSIYNGNGDNFAQGSPWYQVYADYALAHGIIDSAPADYGKAIYRGDFAYILANALPDEALEAVNSVEDGAIPDVPSDSYISGAVYKLYRTGVLTGNDTVGTFAPDSYIDRASVAAIVTRMADPSQRKSIALKEAQVVLYAPDARVISVPVAEVETYVAAGWSKIPVQLDITESGPNWQYANGYLYVTANGAGDVDRYTTTWMEKNQDTHTLYVRQGATSIHFFAFSGWNKLGRVELPSTLAKIDTYSFDKCAITRIGIPGSVTQIEYNAFSVAGGIKGLSQQPSSNASMVIYAPAGSVAEQFAKEYGIPFVPATQVAYPDGRTCMVSESERPIYLANGWYETMGQGADAITMYALDGRTQQVATNNVTANQAVGWYLYPDYVCAKADQMMEYGNREEAITYLESHLTEEVKAAQGTSFNYTSPITRNDVIGTPNGLKYFEKKELLCQAWSKAIGSPIAIVKSNIDHNSIGIPEVYITFRNLTGKDISALEVEFTCIDAYGKVTTDWPSLYNGNFTGYMEDDILKAYTEDTYCWTLYSNERTASIRNPHIVRAAATDGTRW